MTIYSTFVIIIRVSTRMQVISHSKVSHLSFLEQSKVSILNVFSWILRHFLKDQPARGSLAVGIKVLRTLHQRFHFVSLTLILLTISFLIIVEIYMIWTYLSAVINR